MQRQEPRIVMVDIADVRKRVRLTIEQSRKYAQERRDRVALVEREIIAVLEHVVTPVFRAVAAALKAEGYLFRVLTPPGSVRLVAETKEENFIELRLDSMRSLWFESAVLGGGEYWLMIKPFEMAHRLPIGLKTKCLYFYLEKFNPLWNADRLIFFLLVLSSVVIDKFSKQVRVLWCLQCAWVLVD